MAIKFGTDGWRAIISDEFTFANVRVVGQAIANYLHNHKLDGKQLIVGYDPRFLADKFAEEVVKVMESNSISCLFPERDTPTPVIAFCVKDLKASGAVMLTASHNPPEYCGIKFIPSYAGPASLEITKEIEGYIANPEVQYGISSGKKAGAERFNPRERYLKYLETIIDIETIKRAKLKVVCDPMFGSGRGYLDHEFERLNCTVFALHSERDVLFGGSLPEPSEEHLKGLCQKVVNTKADLGLATDGDADRFGVVDETGRFYCANEVISMLASYLIEDKGYSGSIVRSVATTHMLDKIAAIHKMKLHETPVGFKYIAEIMMKEAVVIGGEESGGLSIRGHIPEKDGILANLLVAEMVAKKKKPLSQIFANLEGRVGKFYSKRVNMHIAEEKKASLISKLKSDPPKDFAGRKVAQVRTLDGVKLILDDGSWLLLRPSGTEPLLRAYFESGSRETLRAMEEAAGHRAG